MTKSQFPKFKLVLGALVVFWSLVFSQVATAEQTFPQLDIQGFKKWEYKKADVSPASNYFTGLTQLGGFSPTFTGGPWQERLQLRILGQLSGDLAVSYDLEQQPENPDKYDVKVKYGNNELTFGDLTANFTGNEFASTQRYLNGVMLSLKDTWYDVLTVPSGKLKSQTQQLTSQKGNNTRGPYSLGHGSIVENSERLELNGVVLTRNVDYTIDYFEGKVTFNKILIQTDEFKYSYEYTNLIDLFFPSLSKRDFFGFQSRFTINPDLWGKPEPKPEPVVAMNRETFPSAGSEEPEAMETEASGQYLLDHAPIIKFSERLTFMGTLLKKDEDYLIRYDSGEIKLLTRVLPTPEEPLTVEYNYNQTSVESVAISGIGSRGPYHLAANKIIPGSEKIEVDSKLFVRDLDYTIDYNKGDVVFGVIIGPTSQIKAQYLCNVVAVPPQITSKYPKELKLGATYLRESAKKGVTSPTATTSDRKTGSDLKTSNYLFYLANRPFTTSESGAILTVTLDGRVLSREVDYCVPTTQLDPATGYYLVSPEAKLAYRNDRKDPSDGYQTGTIYFFNPAQIADTSEVTVTYTYYKNIAGKYSGVGDGTQGPYYLRNVRNIIPGGDVQVQVWDQGSSTYVNFNRNSSLEGGDAGAAGYSINYDSNNPSITFNNPLVTTKNFQIIYQYIPPQANSGGDLTQAVWGVDASMKIGDLFNIDSAYAKSETDQLYIALTTTESFSGTGAKNYTLHAVKDIIEASEKISINNKLLNKDVDYFISYTAPGQITFYYLTPATSDAIAVDYQYQSTAGIVVGGDKKVGAAYRLGAATKVFGDVLSINGNTKRIDYDFTPLGGTQIGVGSEYKEYNVKFVPNYHSLSTVYSYKENNNPIGSYVDRFLKSYDNSLVFGVNPNSLAKVDLAYRNYRTLDDLLPGASAYNSDNEQNTYTLSLVPADWQRGALLFTQKYDASQTVAQTDTKRDSSQYSQTTTNFTHANANLKFTERFGAGFDLQLSEPRTIALKSSSTEATAEALSAQTQALDTAYNFNLDLTFGFLQKWTTRVNLQDHQEKTFVRNFTATREALVTKNETYHTDFIPFSILTSSLDHNRQERTAVVIGEVNPKTERTTAAVKLSPISWFSAGWNGSNSDSIPETGVINRTSGRSNAYNLDYIPISFSLIKLATRFSLSDNYQLGPSGTTGEVNTNTNTFTQNYTLNLNPLPILPLSLGWTIENYQNKNDHPVVSSRIDTETQNETMVLGVMFIPTTQLSLSSTYNQKTTRIVRDISLSPQDRKKTILESKVSYQPVSWSTLTYERQEENNGGEIQAGAVADINYQKASQTLSLSLNLPVDNPVLSSFVFTASMKTVDYKNLKNPAGTDDFVATRTQLEGSLNF